MTPYIYAVQVGDWTVQHLLETPVHPALCGLTLDRNRWHFGDIARRAFPGIPLCEACNLEREARKADERAAELREQAAAIKTFWLQEASRT
jgi:hypothetical protein